MCDSLSEFDDCYQHSLVQKMLDTSNTSTESVPGGLMAGGPLTASLFPFVPPYIAFASHIEKGPDVPADIQKLLKWKLTTITPTVVRQVLVNSGFRLLRSKSIKCFGINEFFPNILLNILETNEWIGVWGKHMKSSCFKQLRPYQKINHIPGTLQIGRKDHVWRNLQMQMVRHGKKEFGFMPRYMLKKN